MVAVTRTTLLKRQPPAIDASILAGVVCCWAVGGVGCRSRAYEDVYQQRLTGEIRMLEDELYEADYENRVLAKKLHRAKERAAACAEPSGELAVPSPPERPIPKAPPAQPTPEGRRQPAEPDLFDLEDDLGIDPGQPFEPGEPEQRDRSPGEARDLLPAPGGPQPPGERDLRIPPIEEGEPVPPPSPGEEDDGPPGKIELDDALSLLGQPDQSPPVPRPQTLRLQPGFSGGHHLDADDQVDGLLLVVSVIDDTGSEVDLSQFEIAAGLTVVALDPLREPSEARLAKWEFAADELPQLIAARPVHGLHIPVAWQEKRPLGEQVAVHVRLKAEDEQLSCEATLPVQQPAAIAEWTPRGKPQ